MRSVHHSESALDATLPGHRPPTPRDDPSKPRGTESHRSHEPQDVPEQVHGTIMADLDADASMQVQSSGVATIQAREGPTTKHSHAYNTHGCQ